MLQLHIFIVNFCIQEKNEKAKSKHFIEKRVDTYSQHLKKKNFSLTMFKKEKTNKQKKAFLILKIF